MSDRRLRRRQKGFASALSASLRAIWNAEEGVTALEYAFIAGLVTVVIVAAVITLGGEVSGLFNSVLNGF
jgi:pilus assembly protein Flp/PilA